MTVSLSWLCRIRSAQCALAVAGVLALQAAHAADCGSDKPMAISGDVPAAISYDVFVAARPVDPRQLARFVAAQQVKMLRNGTVVCEIADDGVTDPNDVLIRVPHGAMNYWVKRWNLKPAADDDGRNAL